MRAACAISAKVVASKPLRTKHSLAATRMARCAGDTGCTVLGLASVSVPATGDDEAMVSSADTVSVSVTIHATAGVSLRKSGEYLRRPWCLPEELKGGL